MPENATSVLDATRPRPGGAGAAQPDAEPPPPASEAAPARTASRNPWRCLRTPSMRWWSVANLVSNLGTWMQLTVQNLLVLQLTGSAATTGVSLAVQAAPGLLLGLAGGAVVDRLPRKLTAAVSQSVLGVVALVTAVLVGCGLLTVPVLLALSAVTGIVATVDGPATSLLGNDLVRREDVPSAIALGSAVHSVGRLAGTALASVALATVGSAGAYVMNGLSFVFVAAVIPFLRLVDQGPQETVAPEPKPKVKPSAMGELRDGMSYFLGRPRLVALAVIAAVSSMLGRNYQLTLATLVTGPLHGSSATYGVVSTVLAIGGTLGALLAGRSQSPTVRKVGWLAAAGGALQVLAGLSPVLPLLILLVVPMAVVESVSDTATTTVLQTDPPPHARGRVLGVWRSLSTAWGLVGPPLLGLLVQVCGARGALVGGGLAIVLVVAGGALLHARRTGGPAMAVEPAV
ncbi:MFS transporter [Streptomyces sp. NPDC059740]|uniref:MFS transporter n=1 Tax=Streptomyces sp. NPDC059740 TaxID=3346926 RepID=UPI00366256E2